MSGKKFIVENKVRMHDTDAAGILYFARQFRFAHDAIEDFVESVGHSFKAVFSENHFAFVIVHAEADYKASLQVGDNLEVQLFVSAVGKSSFTLACDIYRKEDQLLVGTTKTVHVTLDRVKREKITIPDEFRAILNEHLC